MTVRPRILLVQFAGDFRAAYETLQKTGKETYYGHRYLLQQLERMQQELGDVAILCCLSGEAYQETLPNGVTVMGAGVSPRKDPKTVVGMIAAYDPTHLIVLGPIIPVLRWGLANKRRMMCQIADSFNMGLVRRLYRYGRLGALLNRPEIEWVANHGFNACRSLVRIGVRPEKVLAWDWPYSKQPQDIAAKDGPGEGVPTLLYVGLILRAKGVGDVIGAVAELKKRGIKVALHIAGKGDIDRFKALAAKLGVTEEVTFLGLIPNDTVFERMRQAAMVIVPSRHAYPEGMPLTIYEALTARTPIVASDHPMFAGNLRNGESGAIFRAGRPAEMADRIAELLADPALYARLSHNAQAAWERLQNPVKWGDTLYQWVSDREEDRAWLAERTISALQR